MAEAGKGDQEPSMEEILSSIRRIIADEEAGPEPGTSRQVAATAAGDAGFRGVPGRDAADDEDADEDGVLELTEVVEPPPVPSPAASAGVGPGPVGLAPPPSAPRPSESLEQPVRSTPMGVESLSEDLISAGTADVSTSALARLARRPASEERPASPLAGVTVERLLVDLMTPMLKEWLDQNLPPLVERVVEQEVKKLARRAEML